MLYKDEYTLTGHIESVKKLMVGARQTVREFIDEEPSVEERILRAKLHMEETLEIIRGLGVSVIYREFAENLNVEVLLEETDLIYIDNNNYDRLAVLDGACDIYVITTGTMMTCGMQGFPSALEAVDLNNLTKLGDTPQFREDGKLLKPDNYQPVDLSPILETMYYV